MRKIFVVLGLVLLFGVIALRMGQRKAYINSASFSRIQEGMNYEQVQEIMGVPPGVYTSLSTYNYMPRLPSFGLKSKWFVRDHLSVQSITPQYKCWFGDQCFICIHFTSDNKVSDKFFYRAQNDDFTLFEKLWGAFTGQNR